MASPATEGLTPQENIAYLSHFGHSELRTSTVAVMAAHQENPFTVAELYKEVMALQGSRPAWKPKIAMPFYYANALIPLGVATEISIPSVAGRHTEAKALRIHPEAAPKLLAYCGVGIDWSQKHPNLSLHQLWGGMGGGHTHAPAVRFAIFNTLLNDHKAGEYAGHLYEQAVAAEVSFRTFANQITRLGKLGILRVACAGALVPEAYSGIHIAPEHRKAIEGFIVLTRTLGHVAAIQTFGEVALDALRNRTIFSNFIAKGERFRTQGMYALTPPQKEEPSRPIAAPAFRAPEAKETETPELTRTQLIQYLNHFGSFEIKLLVAAILAATPGTTLTAGGLHRELLLRQGPQYAWKPHNSVPIHHCKRSLAPAGVAEVVDDAPSSVSGITRGARAIPAASRQTLAMCGALLSWSLDYPDISLQQILGSGSAYGRSPELRTELYRTILKSETGIIQVWRPQLFALQNHTPGNLRSHVRQLVDRGILVDETVHSPNAGNSYPKMASLHPDFQEPIVDLLERLDQLHDPTDAKDYQALAQRIIDDPDLVHSLMEKANFFSADNESPKGESVRIVEEKLLHTAAVLGRMTIRQALAASAELKKPAPSRQVVMRILRDLTATGRLDVAKAKIGSPKRLQVLYYSPKTDEATQA